VELRVEALARYAKRQNPEDPISFLEDILFQTIDEVQMAGKITSVSEGGGQRSSHSIAGNTLAS